ncbi:hypothetical protein RGQ29_032157 [Quercus rubra]|uniref:C2H2-type domain-containing protein n=1 Tax=Quercus rubra TaxID=3512 RepID=A0AAN7DT42_QUERU|nr:hypothetical protein RGQ29_032157 [Quercus rubra]
MGEYRWNMRHGNMHEFNNSQRHHPYMPTQIACRICNRVFVSTQALINHIESHMVNEEALCPNPLRPNFALSIPPRETPQLFENRLAPVQPIALPERHHFYGGSRFIAPQPNLLPLLPPMPMNKFALPPQMMLSAEQTQRRMVEEPPSDCTRPFIDQLDHPIVLSIQAADSNNDDDKLDLTLKL